jgi:hypothetical protein
VFRRRRRIQKRRLALGRLAEEHAQVDPVDELHDEEAGAVGFTEVEDLHHVGVRRTLLDGARRHEGRPLVSRARRDPS